MEVEKESFFMLSSLKRFKCSLCDSSGRQQILLHFICILFPERRLKNQPWLRNPSLQTVCEMEFEGT